MLLVEHDMSLVHQVCDKVWVLDFGRLIFDGTAAEMLNSDVVKAAYLGSEPTPSARQPAADATTAEHAPTTRTDHPMTAPTDHHPPPPPPPSRSNPSPLATAPTTVLWDVDLEVPASSVVALLGPNGAGKTTLLRAACGFISDQQGTSHGRRRRHPPPHDQTARPACATYPKAAASSPPSPSGRT